MLIGLERVVARCCGFERGSRSDPNLYQEVRRRLGFLVSCRQLEPKLLKLVDPLTWCGAAVRHVYGDAEILALVAQASK